MTLLILQEMIKMSNMYSFKIKIVLFEKFNEIVKV